MSDRFTGDWLVSEYVYNADGSFAGVIQQRRKLQRRDDGTIRVVQQCVPGVELKNHAMAAFAGEWVFTMTRDGRARRYHGPDVIGMGLAWGDNCITGRGVWTRFGHNFTSFGVMVTPERQITGGKFYNAGELVANIVGVAVPETADSLDAFPTLSGATWAGNIAARWCGEQSIFDADGEKVNALVRRSYQADEWQETQQIGGREAITVTRLETLNGRMLALRTGKLNAVGIAKRNGPLLDLHMHSAEDHSIGMEVLDSTGGYLVCVDQLWSQNADCVRSTFVVMTAEI